MRVLIGFVYLFMIDNFCNFGYSFLDLVNSLGYVFLSLI